jgi:hypothetical protein
LQKTSFNINGTELTAFRELNKFGDGRFAIQVEDTLTYVQLHDNRFLRTNFQVTAYDTILHWYKGKAAATATFGAIDSTGKVVIPFVANWPLNFYDVHSQTVTVSLGGKNNQVIDNAGNILFDGHYDAVRPFYGGKFIVTRNMRSGVVDRNEKVIIPVRYSFVDIYHGRLRASDDGRIEYFDTALLFRR